METKVLLITPKMAADFLLRNQTNRPLNKNTVQAYAYVMRQGKWQLNGETIVFSKDNTLIDGQHRLAAIIESGCSVQAVVVRGVNSSVFHTIDCGMNRKLSDVFAIEKIPNAFIVSSIVSKVLTLRKKSVGVLSESGGYLSKIERIEKAKFLSEYHSSSELYQEVSKISRSLYSKVSFFKASDMGGIMVYLIKDMEYDTDEVCGFFTMLVTGEKVFNNTIKLLRERLIKDSLAKAKMPPKYKFELLVKTWNNYIHGSELKVLRKINGMEENIWFK